MKHLLLPALFSASLLIGCGASTDSSDPSASKPGAPTIAVIPKGESHVFWKTVQAGALKAGVDLGAEVVWKGPDIENDRNAQVQTVMNFTIRKVDAIAVAPIDGEVLQRPVGAASAKGIQTVVFDSSLVDNSKSVSFVATDNHRGGELCGEAMAKALGGKGKVLVMRMMEGAMSTTKREEGFISSLKKAAPDVEWLSTDQYGGNSVGSAQEKAIFLLAKYGDRLDGIFCPNESTTEGMLMALRKKGMAGKVKFVGFDANTVITDAIAKGEIEAVAVQNPWRMGYLAVEAAHKAIKGESVDARIDTGVAMVNGDNLMSQEMQDLVNPKL